MNQALTFPVTVFLTLLQRPFVYLSPPETRPLSWIYPQLVAMVDVVVDQCGEEVVCSSHCGKITCEREVDVVAWLHL